MNRALLAVAMLGACTEDVIVSPLIDRPHLDADAEAFGVIDQIVIAIAPEGNQPMTTYYEDLRPVDGVMVAHRIRTQTPSFEIILTSTEVKHNLLIDDSKFARPKI